MSEETTKPPTSSSAEGQGLKPGGAPLPRGDKDSLLDAQQRVRTRRRRKVSYLTINKIDSVDYKETTILRRFLNDRGKMLPSRQTGNTAKQQRMIAEAIKKAREMALLPFVVTEMTAERREPRRDRGDRGDRGDRPYTPRRDYDSPREERAPAPAAAPATAAEAPATE